MDALSTLINKIKQSKEQIKKNAIRIMYKKDKEILQLLKDHSPVDTGTFRDNWKASRLRYKSSDTLAEIVVTNATKNYGQFMITGAEPRQAPWYYPHRDSKTGKFKKGTGKLKGSGGKVWSGGLNPGHDKTIGGPIEQALSKYADKFTQEVSDEFVKGFI